MGGQALRQHRTRFPAGSEPIRGDGEGAGSDRLRARGKPGRHHPDDPDAAKGLGDGWTPDQDREPGQRERPIGETSGGPE